MVGLSAPQPFSLLLPVYAGDDPAFLRRAFASATSEQSLPPDQVVLVRDGPVPPDLARTLDELAAACPVPLERVDLPVNGGLARALEAGLERSAHEVVARMDADDVSLPQRFAVQVPLLSPGPHGPGADVVGSALEEFAEDETVVVATRTPPLAHADIVARARFHSPFNHPTVVYRRSAVAAAGGYRDLPLLEDYWLFARMIAAGARTANVAEPLVRYRVGSGSYVRRGGVRLLRSELSLQAHLLHEGFTSPAQAVRNSAVRGGYRLLPEAVRRSAYRATFARRARSPRPPG